MPQSKFTWTLSISDPFTTLPSPCTLCFTVDPSGKNNDESSNDSVGGEYGTVDSLEDVEGLRLDEVTPLFGEFSGDVVLDDTLALLPLGLIDVVLDNARLPLADETPA
jgi:hypothetical protein